MGVPVYVQTDFAVVADRLDAAVALGADLERADPVVVVRPGEGHRGPGRADHQRVARLLRERDAQADERSIAPAGSAGADVDFDLADRAGVGPVGNMQL